MNGPLAITPSDILAYCELYGIKVSQTREDFSRFIMALDDAFFEHVSEVREKEKQKTGKTSNPSRRSKK